MVDIQIQSNRGKTLGGSKADVVGGVVRAAMKCTNGLSLQVQSDSFVFIIHMRFRLLDILFLNI